MFSFLTVAMLHFLSVVSPGPDFAVTVKQAVVNSREHAMWTALGITSGILVHLSYSMFGLALLIQNSPKVFTGLKLISALYLIYLGLRSLFKKKTFLDLEVNDPEISIASFRSAWLEGFCCNVFNPKASIFFLGIFSLFMVDKPSYWIQCALVLEMLITTFLWFFFIGLVISHPRCKRRLQSMQFTFNKVMGLILILFGIRMITI